MSERGRRAAVLAIVAIVIATAWLAVDALRQPTLPPPSNPPADGAPGSAPAAAVEVEVAPLGRDAAPTPPAVTPDADDSALEVIVVDAAGAPVPGAEVRYHDAITEQAVGDLPLARRRALWNDPDALLRELGQTAHTDADGRFLVRGRRPFYVQARDGERFGEGRTGFEPGRGASDEPQLRVVLGEDLTLRVQLLTVNATPAKGVQVQVTLGHDDEQQDLTVLTSDDRGIAALPHAQRLERWPWHPRLGQPTGFVELRLRLPEAAAPVRLDPRALPREPVPMQLPATGSMRVHVLLRGRPFAGCDDVQLLDSAFGAQAAWSGPLREHGPLEFPHLPLDREYLLGCSSWSAELTGPRSSAPHVEHTVELADLAAIVTGRLLTADGAPLRHAGASVELVIGTEGELSYDQLLELATDGDGRFVVVLAQTGDELLRLRELTFETHAPGSDPSNPPHRAELGARVLPRGVTDLGDVALAPPRLLVSGRLLADAGAPLSAGLRMEQFDDGAWRGIDEPPLLRGDDGSFVAWGTTNTPQLRLVVHTEQHPPVAPVEFTPGTRDLLVHLRRGADVVLRAQLPPALGERALGVWLSRPDAPGSSRTPLEARRVADGVVEWSWTGASEGPALLRVRIEASGTVVHEQAFSVRRQADGAPQRFAVDLRQRVAPLQITVRRGAPRRHAQQLPALFVEPQTGPYLHGVRLSNGPQVVAVPPGANDLLVTFPGEKPLRLRAQQSAAAADAEPFPVARVQALASDLPAGVTLSLRLEPVTPEQRVAVVDGYSYELRSWTEPRDHWTPLRDGRCELQLSDGRYSLQAQLRRDGHFVDLRDFTPRELDAGGDYQLIVPPAELQRALAELRGKR
ncbi:MAG: carboxypeptidase-like regulatory domain-containing protein [Planctomycetota bacterium]